MNDQADSASDSSIAELFTRLVEVIAALRGENGCPWDREQTRDSVKMNLVEEAYEALDAIGKSNPEMFAQELGDLMMQVVFHARISEEMGEFDISDVLSAAIGKLVRRHPHVFADLEVKDSKEVLKNWEEIKMAERGAESVLADVPRSLPGFLQALVVQDKVGRVGFEWPDFRGAFDKLREEIIELEDAIKAGDQARINAEYGDLLFVALNLGRYLKANPDDALRDAVRRFGRRFRHVEASLRAKGKTPVDATLELMDSLWDESKVGESGS